jgi:4-hydroxybutyrate CoA-transferase
VADEVPPYAAFRGVGPGSRVLAAPCCGTPETLLRELGRHAERTDGLQLTTGLTLGSFPHLAAVRAGRLRYRTWHPSGPDRDLVAGGLAEYLPLRAHDVRPAITGAVDVLLLRVSPPGRDGWCSTGPTASFTRAAVETARLVIAEVDPALPRTDGDSRVHLSEIGRLVGTQDPTPRYPGPDGAGPSCPGPRAAAIAGHVAALIPDGATVQLGPGPVAEAVAELLAAASPRPPRVRVIGVLTEPMTRLAEAASGTVLAAELLGGPALMAWADRNPRLRMASSDRVHDPVFLSQAGPLVSVMPAVSVDLTGQAACDEAGGRVLSGIGGGADSFEGARLSGGLRIVALPSVTPRGVPTIVAGHPAGAQVAVPRHSVDAVVTEHGVAWLRGRTLRERREALLRVAGDTV